MERTLERRRPASREHHQGGQLSCAESVGRNGLALPALRKKYRRRRRGQPAWILAVADGAQHRLHRRYVRLCARGKPHNKVNVAIARELVGFIWVALRGRPAEII